MYPEDDIQRGTANLYCYVCDTTTTVRWAGKLSIKRCWKCDTILEERNDGR